MPLSKFICLDLSGRIPDARLRDVAELMGITERAVQRIVAVLEQEGYLVREKLGRRNCYNLNADCPLRQPIDTHRNINVLLDSFVRFESPARSRRP